MSSSDQVDSLVCSLLLFLLSPGTRVIRTQQMPHRVRPFIIAQTANVTSDYRARCQESGMVRQRQRGRRPNSMQTHAYEVSCMCAAVIPDDSSLFSLLCVNTAHFRTCFCQVSNYLHMLWNVRVRIISEPARPSLLLTIVDLCLTTFLSEPIVLESLMHALQQAHGSVHTAEATQ
jgi:CheY-like chemotaxis protein